VVQVFTGQMSLPTNSVKARKGTQSTDANQWPGFLLSYSTIALLREEALPGFGNLLLLRNS